MLKTFLRSLPVLSTLLSEREALMRACGIVPPGHFYSPLVSVEEVRRDEARIFGDVPRELPGLEMNEAAQLALLGRLEAFYPTIDFPERPSAGHRYHYENPAYSYSDAIFLHGMMRHFRPRRIVEVGSGHSSCAMLDTDERWLEGRTAFTFIDPHPALLRSLMRPGDLARTRILGSRLQDVPREVFAELEAGDFLFVDSTHVSKTGSDVNAILFEILPALRPGVHVHFHDVFYPFEYPKEWVLGGWSWNEAYALRAFLQYNAHWSVELMNTFLEHFHEARFAQRMPLCLKNRGGSLWIVRR